MIFDRTLSDVNTAKQLRDEKVKKGIALTDSEKNTIERGFYTINTANRIELAEKELTELLNDMGYYNIGSVADNKTDWDETKMFTSSDHKRLVDKCKKLRNGFVPYYLYDSLPNEKIDYMQLNLLEKSLYDIKQLSNSVKDRYLKCGDNVKSGGLL